MNDSTLQKDSAGEPLLADNSSGDAAPQFGAMDIVEAFTAMRHESRGQTRETRALAEQIQAAVTSLLSLESKLLACVAEPRSAVRNSGAADEAEPLVQLIIETDHQISRAAASIAQWETNRRLRAEADAKAVESFFANMTGLARWFARPLWNFLQQRSAAESSTEDPAVEGLNLILARLRRAMHERGIERLDVVGHEFDADTMHAIGTVAAGTCAAGTCAAGHVAEQLSPAYFWQGRLVRFADVRVAQ